MLWVVMLPVISREYTGIDKARNTKTTPANYIFAANVHR